MEKRIAAMKYGKEYLMRLENQKWFAEINDMMQSFIWSQQRMEQRSFTQVRITRQDTKLKIKHWKWIDKFNLLGSLILIFTLLLT
jgi:hypothetical protein